MRAISNFLTKKFSKIFNFRQEGLCTKVRIYAVNTTVLNTTLLYLLYIGIPL